MSGVGGVGSNSPYVPGTGSPGPVGDGGSVDNAGGVPGLVVTPPAGQSTPAPTFLGGNATGVSYSQPSPLDPSGLVLPASITDSTNVDITACLVLLMKTAIEMRKDQREQWIKQAQNQLATSNTVANLQIQAAQYKFAADCVSNGISAVASIGQAAAACAGARGSSELDNIDAEANRSFGTDEELGIGKNAGASSAKSAALDEGDEDEGDIEGQAKGIISKEGLTADSLGGESAGIEDEDGAEGKASKSLDDAKKANAKQVADEGDADAKGAGDSDADPNSDSSKLDAEKAKLKRDKLSYVANAKSVKSQQFQAKIEIVNGVMGILQSAGKMAGAGLTYQSDLLSAQASQEKALADFQATAASDQLDFANELRDYANSILSTIRDVESARHAASNAIANI
jgi:hypothetical protein